jgi:hypothetical protein
VGPGLLVTWLLLGGVTPDRVTPDRVTPDHATPDHAAPDHVTPDAAAGGPAAPAVAFGGGSLGIEGASACPSPADVSDRLKPLLPPGQPAGPPHRARLARDGRELRLELRDAQGGVLARRRFTAAPCADLAAAAAVVIATWEVELRGRGALGLWLEPVPAPSAGPPAVRAPSVPAPRSALELTLGAAALGGAGSVGGIVPGALIEARAGRPPSAAGIWAALAVEGDRTLALAGGTADWQRVVAAAGPRGRWPLGAGRLALEVDAGLLAALLLVRGSAFPRNHDAATFDPGGSASVRLVARAGVVRPWVGAVAWLWPMIHEVAVTGGTETRSLPRVEGFLAVGLALAVHP